MRADGKRIRHGHMIENVCQNRVADRCAVKTGSRIDCWEICIPTDVALDVLVRQGYRKRIVDPVAKMATDPNRITEFYIFDNTTPGKSRPTICLIRGSGSRSSRYIKPDKYPQFVSNCGCWNKACCNNQKKP